MNVVDKRNLLNEICKARNTKKKLARCFHEKLNILGSEFAELKNNVD